MVRLQLIGGGRMGAALLAGVLASGWTSADDVRVVEVADARRDDLAARFDGLVVAAEPGPADGTVVAVKPQHVDDAIRAAVAAGSDRILSIAAGIPLARLEAAAGPGVRVVRAMPNTPALVGAGVAAVAAGREAGEADVAWATELLGAVGEVVVVPESQLDAVTGLSGSGPAYVFLVAEALIDAGVLVGLPRDVATTLATSTLLGSARLLAETGDGPADLRAAVTSPGGTTAAGLRELERHAVRAAIADAVAAATERSRELAGP
jgi:pyrroline-5-carboxylate reductase